MRNYPVDNMIAKNIEFLKEHGIDIRNLQNVNDIIKAMESKELVWLIGGPLGGACK